jgi:hypothetical protein
MLMRNILFKLLAGSWAPNSEHQFRELVAEHHELFKNFTPRNRLLPPKFHFLTHYWRIVKYIGPPVNCWAMREEAKHKVSTSYCKVSANRMNLLKSIAWKHQMIMNERILGNTNYLESARLVKKPVHFSEIDDSVKISYMEYLPSIENFMSIKKVTVLGAEFKVGCVVSIGIDENGYPVFCKVCHIVFSVLDNDSVLFLCEKMEIGYYNDLLGAYCVLDSPLQDRLVVALKDVKWSRAFNVARVGDENYVSLHADIHF